MKKRRRGNRVPNWLIAVIFILIFTIGPYLAFTKHIPFTSYGYEVKATFTNSANISLKSPVRIAGVEVGKVIKTERDGDATTVTFTVDGSGRPIHKNAFATVQTADLPRGQLLHRPRPGQPRLAGTGERRDDPDQPHLDRGADRRSADRAAVAGPRRPRSPAGGLRQRAHPQTDARPKTSTSCRR